MKYKKGTFVVVSNKHRLLGKPPEMLAVYFWLSSHADDEGTCFPTKKLLAQEAGCSHNTVDKYLKLLVEEGFISIEHRKKRGSKENTSNLYQLHLMGDLPPTDGMTLPPSRGSETISNINSTHLTQIAEEESSAESVVELPLVQDITLPASRGSKPEDRVATIYRDLFEYTYGENIDSKIWNSVKSNIKKLLAEYSEIQLAFLLIVFFTWKGMDGNSESEIKYLMGKTFPMYLFVSNIKKYKIYCKNVLYLKFEDDELLPLVGKHMISLK